MSEANPLFGQIRLIRHTPLLDLIRLRLTGEFDWRSVIAESQLPSSLQTMLVELIRNSKLTRSERTSVAHEIVAHFEDGHQDGKDWIDLESEFGDPAIAAQLIQRSKERNRSMWSRALKYFGVASLAGIVVVTLWGYLFLQREANPSVDYTKHFNAKVLASVGAERAWPIYRDTWTKYSFVNLNLDAEFAGVSEDGFGSIQPGHTSWPQVEEFLDEHKDLIDALREGSRQPTLGLELMNFKESYSTVDQAALFPKWFATRPATTPEPAKPETERFKESSALAVLLPHVQAFRTAGDLIVADARRAMAAEDVERAIDSVRVLLGIAGHASESSCFVASLVGFAVIDRAFEVVQALLLNEQELSATQMQELQEIIASMDIKTFIDPNAERVMIYDVLQRTYTDDGNGNGRITKQGLAIMSGLFPAMHEQNLGVILTWKFLRSKRENMTELFDAFYEEYEKDLLETWSKQPRSVQNLMAKSFEAESPAFYLADTFLSRLEHVRDTYHRQNSKHEATITAVALFRYKKTNGSFPAQLDALVPEYLKSIVNDPLTDRPMSYVLDKDDQPVLYFWGHDGIDDKGAELDGGPDNNVENAFGHSAKGLKGDWVLWSAAKK